VSAFELAKVGGQAPSISINITGLTQVGTIVEESVEVDITDVEIKESDTE
jgi:hypothetical protein